VAPEPAQAEASQCLQRLSEGLAAAKALPPIVGAGGCGVADAVRLEAVITRTGRRVALQPAADLRCSMAEAVVQWVREDVVPALGGDLAPLAAITTAAAYECRGRNRVKGAQLSQHGLGNALDLRALKLADGTILTLTDRSASKELRLKLQETACDRFTTVLGPDSDGYHEDHIHLDLAQRRSGYRLCQWAVHMPTPANPPQVAAREPSSIPLPTPRPSGVTSGARPAAAPTQSKPLPAVRRGREHVHLPLAREIKAPPAARPTSRKEGSNRSTSCRAGHNCRSETSRSKPSRRKPSRRKAHSPHRSADPFADLRRFFR
jgi:hypothetical protein